MSVLGLDNSSVIITGAGSGIGRHTALRFAAEGARVVAAEIHPESAESVVNEIREAGGTAVPVIGDLSDQRIVDEVVATATETYGRLDVLVNNAGVMDRMSATADTTDTEWERLLRINLTAPFLLTRAALVPMLSQGSGAIVNSASEAGLRGSAAGTAYTVSKHGVVGLTKSTAIMYRDQGIRTNAIAPGPTSTGIDVDLDPAAHGPAAIGAYGTNIGRVSEPQEQAAAILFLASGAASNINGVVLPVDSGWSAV